VDGLHRARGYDVYLLDIRGYGKSTRPPELAQPPDANPPIVRTATAVKDISAVIVDSILKRRNIPRLVLLGWSWARFHVRPTPTQNPSKVERLVLYAPIWIGMTGRLAVAKAGARLPPTARSRAKRRARWYKRRARRQKATLIPAGFFDAWADATFATDAEGAKMDPPILRAPNGVMADCAEYWWVGKSYYDPAKVTAPALLVTAAWDSPTERTTDHGADFVSAA